MNDTPWVIKYQPASINDMILTQSLKDMFNNCVSNKNLSNMTFYGIAGCGKTTLAKVLAKELNCDVHFQSCSADGSIDMIKSTILNYCQIMADPDKKKLIILDEADQLSQQAQMALRNIIVDSLDDTRFILTCNYIDKIIPAIQSRCTPIKLEFSTKEVALYIVDILKKENITYTNKELGDFILNVIKKQYPDVRSIIERLQLSCEKNELKTLNNFSSIVEDEVINTIINTDNVMKIREYLLSNEDKFSADYIKLAGDLFNVYKNEPAKMIIIADYIYKMTLVLDKEIQFTAMLIELKSKGK